MKSALLLAALSVGSLLLLPELDLFERLYQFTRAHEHWEIDEIIVFGLVAVLLSLLLLAKAAWSNARALARSETRFRDIAEISGDWIWEQDSQFRFTYVSERFETVTGLQTESVLGRTRETWAGDFEITASANQRERIAQRKSFRDLRYAYRRDDGRQVHFSTSGNPVFSRTGRFLGYRGTATDITERTLAERRLQAALAAADAANLAKSAFLANMSHELRTPLNAIIGFSEIVEGRHLGPDDPRYDEYLTYIRESADHLLSIINDVLDIAQVEAGKVDLAPEPLALDEAVAMMLRLMTPQAEAKQIALVNAVPSDLVPVLADPQRLRQILLNLLGNAVKFTPAGGQITVRAAALPGRERLCLEIEDQGIGIAADALATIFEPFVQLDAGLDRRHEGSGLGLALVKRHVELHGGTIEMISEPGKGALARVELPSAGPADVADERGDDGLARIAAPVTEIAAAE